MKMVTNLNRSLLLGVAVAALMPVAPLAAQTVAEGVSEDAEIIVSARRRDERLIDVPVAVTALSAQDVERLQAVDLSGLQGASPNLNIVQGRGSAASANIFIRGIGQPDALADLRSGRRRLYRWRLSQPHPGRACSTWAMSSASRCCAGRRARSMARTPPAARSASYRKSPI